MMKNGKKILRKQKENNITNILKNNTMEYISAEYTSKVELIIDYTHNSVHFNEKHENYFDTKGIVDISTELDRAYIEYNGTIIDLTDRLTEEEKKLLIQ